MDKNLAIVFKKKHFSLPVKHSLDFGQKIVEREWRFEQHLRLGPML
jgi:hypothetical protein